MAMDGREILIRMLFMSLAVVILFLVEKFGKWYDKFMITKNNSISPHVEPSEPWPEFEKEEADND